MKIPKGKAQIDFILSEKLKDEFTQAVTNGKRWDVLRGMLMLYLSRPHFRQEVDKFVEVTKTI